MIFLAKVVVPKGRHISSSCSKILPSERTSQFGKMPHSELCKALTLGHIYS